MSTCPKRGVSVDAFHLVKPAARPTPKSGSDGPVTDRPWGTLSDWWTEVEVVTATDAPEASREAAAASVTLCPATWTAALVWKYSSTWLGPSPTKAVIAAWG